MAAAYDNAWVMQSCNRLITGVCFAAMEIIDSFIVKCLIGFHYYGLIQLFPLFCSIQT